MDATTPRIRDADLLTLITQIVEHIPDMVFVKDAQDLRFVLFNKAGEKLLGHSREDLLGKNDFDFFPPEQAEFFTSKDREVLASGELLDIPEEPIETPRGRRWLHTKKVPLHDEDGTPRYLLGISEDITERRRVERMKDDLVSVASHELRSPTVALLGALSLVKEISGGDLDGEAKRMLELGEENGQRLLDLVESCLDLSQLEHEGAGLHVEEVDLEQALREALRLNQPYARRFRARVTLGEIDKPALVRADPHRLLQVLTNLIANAAKFSPKNGEVKVSASAHGRWRRVSVADQGPGIPEGFRERIFDKFARARTAQTVHREGSGLGLTIARQLVERMGGAIGFETEIGEGTTFYVDLPTA